MLTGTLGSVMPARLLIGTLSQETIQHRIVCGSGFVGSGAEPGSGAFLTLDPGFRIGFYRIPVLKLIVVMA